MSDSQNAEGTKRKRKWDVVTPEASNLSADQVATMAAKKLNAMLASQGVTSTSAFEREVEINDCKPEIRYQLCKGTTHDEILEKTGATVRIRGKYKAPGDTSPDRPLHLFITSDTAEGVAAAVQKIQEIMKGGQQEHIKQQVQAISFVHKVMVGMEGSDPDFNLIPRILGPNHSFIDHIAKTTRATVILRGVGSGFLEGPEEKESTEALHLYINAQNKQMVDYAKGLCENLLSTVRQEYYNFSQQKRYAQSYYPPGYGNQYQQYYYNYQYPYAAPNDPQAGVGGSQAVTGAGGVQTVAPSPASSSVPSSSTATSSTATSSTPEPSSQSGTKDDESSFYAELAQIDKSFQKPDTSPQTESSEPTVKESKEETGSAGKSEETTAQPAEDGESTKQGEKGEPFWAARSAIDDANPQKRKEEETDALKEDIYKDLGMKK